MVETLISRCLDSVIQNTYRTLQIICVDDGSTDKSGEILDDYAARDVRISVLHMENGGVSRARNAGLKAAKGQYIAFVDADDWIHPQFFELLTRLAIKHSADVMISNHIRTGKPVPSHPRDSEKVSAAAIALETVFERAELKNYVWGKLYKAALLEHLLFHEGISFGEDALFNARVYCSAPEMAIYYTEECLYYYYDRPGSLVHNGSGEMFAQVGQALFECAEQSQNAFFKCLYLGEAIKKTLAARYSASVCSKYAIVESCNTALKEECKALKAEKTISVWKKLLYQMLYRYPGLYRRQRIKEDPTLLDWEKQQIGGGS